MEWSKGELAGVSRQGTKPPFNSTMRGQTHRFGLTLFYLFSPLDANLFASPTRSGPSFYPKTRAINMAHKSAIKIHITVGPAIINVPRAAEESVKERFGFTGLGFGSSDLGDR